MKGSEGIHSYRPGEEESGAERDHRIDEESLKTVYDYFTPPYGAGYLYYLKNFNYKVAKAEEASTFALKKALDHIHEVEHKEALGPWISTLATNAYIDFSKRSEHKLVLKKPRERLEQLSHAATHPDRIINPIIIRDILSRMPADESELLRKNYQDDLSIEEILEEVPVSNRGIPYNDMSLRSKIARAKKRFKDIYNSAYNSESKAA